MKLFQCVRENSVPDVPLPTGTDLPSVRQSLPKPEKADAVRKHQSRFV